MVVVDVAVVASLPVLVSKGLVLLAVGVDLSVYESVEDCSVLLGVVGWEGSVLLEVEV